MQLREIDAQPSSNHPNLAQERISCVYRKVIQIFRQSLLQCANLRIWKVEVSSPQTGVTSEYKKHLEH